jgi:hypothetical protein
VGPPPNDDVKSAIFGRSLLERAGLSKKDVPNDSDRARYNVMSDAAGQIKDPNRPV